MKPFLMLLLLLSLVLSGCNTTTETTMKSESPAENTALPTSVLDFTMKDITANDVALNSYSGSVIMIVNTASKCGFTPQYAGLEELYKRFRDKGFIVLGFPANDFLWQEPGSDEDIQQFCTMNYGVTFPMFSKISVKGNDIHPLYAWLTGKDSNPEFSGSISWNFNKFLVGRNGAVINRFGSRTDPLSDEVVTAVEAALAQ